MDLHLQESAKEKHPILQPLVEVKTIKKLQMNFGTGVGSWIHCGFLGNQWLFNVKPFLETCIFHIVNQPKGLGVRDSDSVYGKNAGDEEKIFT